MAGAGIVGGGRRGEGKGAAGGWRWEGGGGATDGVGVHVHRELKTGPEKHGGAVDIRVGSRGFAALQLKCKMLVQADAEEDPKAVVGDVNERFGEGMAKGKGRGEDGSEFPRKRGDRRGRKECGQERVFEGCVVDKSKVEVEEGCLDVVGLLVFFDEVGCQGRLIGSS